MTTLTANEVFRDYNTDGVPASGAHKPVKAEIREYLTDRVEQVLGVGATFVPTMAALKAVDTTLMTNVYVTDPLRAGLFSFRSGDYEDEVDADTAEGIYAESDDVAKTVGAWVRQFVGVPQAAWFGASPDAADTANTTAFNAAATMIATLGMATFLALSPGAYASTNTPFQLAQVVLTGEGKIEMDGFLQAPNRSLMTVDPGDASDSRYELFDGLTDKTQQQSYAFVGPAVGSVTGATYRTITAAAREVSVYDFVGGFNTNPGDHSLGRSGVFEELHRVYHGGQGDLTQRQIYGEVYSALPGATHFLANPAIGIENGGVAASGAATGAYLQLTEHLMVDNGLAVAAVARVTNFIRTNAGVALGQVWVHDRPQSGGSVSIDAAYTPAGAWKRGLDFTPTTLDADKAAVVLKASDRIYFNATSAADALGIKWFATTLGSIYLDSNGTSLRSSVGLTPVANDGAALGVSGTAWSDVFLASGAVLNFNAGDVTVTHSANALAFAGASSGYSFDAGITPAANDGAALGVSGTAWADVFLASGAVINFNAGDVLVTHAANSLAFSGASSGYTFDAAVLPSANDAAALGASGTAWADAFFASGAVLNWNAGNVTLTHSANTLSLAANSFAIASVTAFQPQVSVRNSTNDANGAYVMLRKARGVGPDVAVQLSDTVGTFMFQAYDSTGTPVLRNVAYLAAIIESVSAGAAAARFELVAGSSIWQFKTDNTMVLPTATLGTAAASTIEFDGKAFYANAVISSRQVLTAKQIATVQGTAVALSNSSTSAQNIFAAANDTLTVAASTTYRFRAKLSFNTGATTHITSFGLGGTATFTNIEYLSQAISAAANTLATTQQRRVTTAAAAALTATSTAVTTDIWIEGVMRINGAGTIIPQVTFSAGPTGTCETAINSFFELEPIGSDTVAAIGNWA